jgi:N-methylhydantoinase B
MSTVDSLTLEVVRGFLVSTVLQMRTTLLRTAYAPILYDSQDFSCGLLNPEGEVIGMSEDFSGHVFAMGLGYRAALEACGGDIRPGDVLAVNDPYTGGTHLNDIAFYTPYFHDNEVVLIIAVRAHFQDVGGMTPGSFSGQDTEIYQEGVRIPAVKLIDEGVRNEPLWEVLFANMRLSEEREGDALAMLDAARVAELRAAELCERYGAETARACITTLVDSAEAFMRGEIERLPDGEFLYEHYFDCAGADPRPVPLRARMEIDGSRMVFDFTGTSRQVEGPMNCGFPVTQGGVFVVVKAWLDPLSPVNGGSFRALEFEIPDGSVLAARLPAPVGGCWDVYRQVQAMAIGLFSQVMPDRLGAETQAAANHVKVGGWDTVADRAFILYEYPTGGTPATSTTDGVTGTNVYDAGDQPSVYPAESIEQREPVLIEELTARPDGEGEGRQRSGFGIRRRIRLLADRAELNVMTDRAIIPPFGVAGGGGGSHNAVTVERDGEPHEPSPIPGKVTSFPMFAEDVLIAEASAGGGVGDPLTRDPGLVAADVRQGYVTLERARDVYGVVLDGDEIELDATRQRRKELAAERVYLSVVETEADDYDERDCRLCRLSIATAEELGVEEGDLVEYLGATPAPLRAWARVSEDVDAGVAPIGPRGRRILGQTAGGRVWIRRVDAKHV